MEGIILLGRYTLDGFLVPLQTMISRSARSKRRSGASQDQWLRSECIDPGFK